MCVFCFLVNSYNRQASQYAEFQQKYIHLSQLYETESKSKWKYLAQIEELSKEVKELREEVIILFIFFLNKISIVSFLVYEKYLK